MKEAEKIVREFSRGSQSTTLTSRDADAYRFAVEKLRPLGICLTDAVTEFIQSKEILGTSSASLPAAAQYFVKQAASIKGVTVKDAIAENLREC